MQKRTLRRLCAAMALAPLPLAVHAAPDCAAVEQFLDGKAVGLVCFHSDNLRTKNAVTTPPDNSISTLADGSPLPGVSVAGLPANFGSYTPTKDRGVISNCPAPSSGPGPGIQVEGWFADDPANQARFVLRFPDDWNGKLVVTGASGTRSEYNGDWAWSDYVLPKGYAYASQNKGVLNFYDVNFGSVTQPTNDRFSCRVNPPGGGLSLLWVHFYDVDPQKPFTQWRRTAGIRCAARWRRRPTCSTAVSTGKERTSRRPRTSSSTCRWR